ncbi:uncharacterized protein LOC135828855 isoform X2 [Sycon ciliatum]|uniref:uncharacterized protein LOC135828855 isoform X2 n=1 Tax=Sycon ciliatum TaxID=27933 RepID=UPI0031F6DDE4
MPHFPHLRHIQDTNTSLSLDVATARSPANSDNGSPEETGRSAFGRSDVSPLRRSHGMRRKERRHNNRVVRKQRTVGDDDAGKATEMERSASASPLRFARDRWLHGKATPDSASPSPARSAGDRAPHQSALIHASAEASRHMREVAAEGSTKILRRRSSASYINNVAGVLNCDPTIMRRAVDVRKPGPALVSRDQSGTDLAAAVRKRRAERSGGDEDDDAPRASNALKALKAEPPRHEPTAARYLRAQSVPSYDRTPTVSGPAGTQTPVDTDSDSEVEMWLETYEHISMPGEGEIPLPGSTAAENRSTRLDVGTATQRRRESSAYSDFDIVSVADETDRVLLDLSGESEYATVRGTTQDKNMRWEHTESSRGIHGGSGGCAAGWKTASGERRQKGWQRRSMRLGTEEQPPIRLRADTEPSERHLQGTASSSHYTTVRRSNPRSSLPSTNSTSSPAYTKKTGRSATLGTDSRSLRDMTGSLDDEFSLSVDRPEFGFEGLPAKSVSTVTTLSPQGDLPRARSADGSGQLSASGPVLRHLPSCVFQVTCAYGPDMKAKVLSECPKVKDTHRFAVRTLLSRVGSVPEAGPLTTMNLLETLQDICLIGDERHSQVVSEESTNMPAGQQCLSVHVVEARSLAAKDPNGFSDPYVIIGMESKTRKTHRHLDDFFHIGLNTRLNAKISPMRMAARARSHSPPRSDQRQKTTSSMLGGGDPGHNEGMSRYKTTEVVYRSLNPKWDETFSMRVDDPNKAVLVLFVVDRDEGGARLPQLRGRKALANIVESVRSLVKAETDDFMGKIVIPIDSIPVRGRTDWFLLKDGEFHHLTKGEILLSIKYVPASRALAEDVSVEEAASLVKTLLKLMYTHEFMDVLTYKRSPQQAFGIGLQPAHQCIIDQVQAQLDITDADLTAMKLLAFHSLAMDHDIVPATRETVVGAILSVDQVGEKIPSASALSPYLAKDLSRTLDTLGNAMLQWGNRLHELFPPSDNASMDIIETLRVFKSVMALPFYIQHNQLSPDYARKRLETVLKDAVGEFYNSFGMPASYSEEKHPQTAGHGLRLAFSERIQSAPYGTVKQVVKGSLRGSKPIAGIRVNPEQVKEGPVAFLKARTDLIPELIAYFESTLQQYATYESLFERNDVKYTRIVIEALGAKIVEEVTTLVVMGTKHVDSGAGEDKKVVLSVMKTLIRLFTISKDVNKFTRRVIEKEVISVEKVFQPVLPYFVVTWTQVTSDHLSKAAELDPMSEVVDGQLYSYSAIDVCLIYNRVLADWDILSDWPDEVSRLMIMVLVVKLICEGCLSYSVLAHERIRLMEVGQALHPNDLIDQSAIIRNNITYVIDHMLLRLVRWFTESSQASSSRLESGSCSSLDRGWKMFKRMPGSERRSSRRLSADLSDGLDVEDEECLNADEVSSFRSRCLGIVRKLVTTTEQHMDNCIQPAHRALLRKTMQGIERMLRKGQVEDAFNSLLGLISRAHGQTKIELSLRLRMVQAYWNSMLDVLARIINDTEKHEEFYTQCSVQLNGSFTALSELAPDSATANFATDQFKSLHTALKMYSEGPEQLQYQFFMMLRDAPPDDKWGSVTIQIGHVPNQVNFAMTNLRINLMHYQGLYATEEDIDTYAVYFQCHVLPSEPRSEFCVRSKTNNGTTDLLEAVVNLSIPQRWVTSESHVVRLSAFHKKMVKDELLGEVIIPLNEVPELAISLYRSLPLKTYNLQLFKIEDKHSIVRCLERRSRQDTGLKKFLLYERTWLKAADSTKHHRNQSLPLAARHR